MAELASIDARGHERWGDAGAGILFVSPQQRLIFLVLRSEEVMDPNRWGIPGGKMEADESPLEAAKREVKEELGSIPEHRILLEKLYRSGDFRFTTFVARVKPKVVSTFVPVLNWENSDAAWFDLDHLPTPILPNVKTVVKSLDI